MPLERDKSNGFKFSLKPLLSTGMFPETFSRSIPLWKAGSNVIFTPHGLEKLGGRDVLVDLGNSEPIRGLLQSLEDNGASAYIYAGDLSNIYQVDTSDSSVTIVGSGYSLSADAGAALWDSGTSSWDSGTTLWDYGITKSDLWSMVTYGDWQFATYGGTPQVRKGIGSFVDMPQGVTGITLTSGGTGYTAGDVLTVTGGDGTGATATVITVDGGGAITSIGMSDAGSGYTVAPTGLSGGTGTTATATFTICDMDVSTVGIFKNFGPHILGFKTNVSGKEFIWCDADDPDTWVAASDNLAGQLEIRELQTDIVAVAPLGSRLAVYGSDQMALVSYLANDLVFGYQMAIDGIGAVSKKSVVSVGRQNFGLSEQGFFVTDGSSFEYIDEPAIRDYYTANANGAQMSKAWAFHDEAQNQIRWFFPTSSSLITSGVSYNYKTNAWSILTDDTSAGDERRILDTPISGSEGGILYRENVGNNDGSIAMVSWARTKPMDFDNADVIKELDSIRIGFEGMGLQYRIGWSETEDGTITWGSYTDMSTGFGFQNLRTAGRWLHFELYSASLNASWEISDVEFIGRFEGTR